MGPLRFHSERRASTSQLARGCELNPVSSTLVEKTAVNSDCEMSAFKAAAQARLAGGDYRLGTVGEVQFGEDVGDVVAHGLVADVEP